MDNKNWWKSLQPLRVPPFWSFRYNKLEMLEPDALSADDPAWQFTLVQDILYLYMRQDIRQVHGERKLAIDLGWYPDGDPLGQYRLVAVLDDDFMNPILEFTSRSTQEVVETMEYWLFQYFSCIRICEPFDEKNFRKWHPDRK